MSKPNRYYGAEGRKLDNGQGYVGTFRAPGLTPDLVRDSEGPIVFPTELEAHAAAADSLMAILNAPRARAQAPGSKRDFFERMTGPEFAEKLKESGLTLTLFAYLAGTSEKRVLQWIDGRNDKGDEDLAPHHIRVLLEIFTRLPKSVDIAEDITDTYSRSASPRVHAPFTPDQVEALRQHQANEMRHPLTCPGERPECSCDANRDLTPTKDGLVCGCGAYTQTWIYEKMTRLKTPA